MPRKKENREAVIAKLIVHVQETIAETYDGNVTNGAAKAKALLERAVQLMQEAHAAQATHAADVQKQLDALKAELAA